MLPHPWSLCYNWKNSISGSWTECKSENMGKQDKKYKCPCCGYQTLDTHGEYDICPVCFWEDDAYLVFSEKTIRGIYYDKEPALDELLDIPSEANHGLTLRQARENYRSFGSCEKEMLPYVRKPYKNEKV